MYLIRKYNNKVYKYNLRIIKFIKRNCENCVINHIIQYHVTNIKQLSNCRKVSIIKKLD